MAGMQYHFLRLNFRKISLVLSGFQTLFQICIRFLSISNLKLVSNSSRKGEYNNCKIRQKLQAQFYNWSSKYTAECGASSKGGFIIKESYAELVRQLVFISNVPKPKPTERRKPENCIALKNQKSLKIYVFYFFLDPDLSQQYKLYIKK